MNWVFQLSDANVSAEHIWLGMDQIVKEDLQKVLTENQLRSIKQVVLRGRYSTPLRCFRDRELLQYLQVSADSKELNRSIELEQSLYKLESNRLKRMALATIVLSLSRESKQRLADYCGDAEMPLGDTTEVALREGLPYSESCRTRWLNQAAHSQGVPNKLRLTANQIKKLDEIYNSQFHAGLENHEATSRDELERAVKRNKLKAITDMRELLDQNQYAFLIKEAAFLELCDDLRSHFERKELIEYLQIKDEDLGLIQEISIRQSRRIEEGTEMLNEQTFKRVAGTLPLEANKRLLVLFDGVWISKRQSR